MIDIIVPLYICDPSLYPIVQHCFEALLRIEGKHHLLSIDDASLLPHDFPVTYRNTENLGFTATVNRGLKESAGDILVVMNDDIELTQECLDRFKSLKGLQIASPRDTASSPDDKFGCCWGMTREVYELLGPLNEKYRNFYSDVDYYQRAKEAGVEIIKWDDLILDHCESATFNTLNKTELLETDAKIYRESNH